jgi:hypothetical protein
MIDQATVRKTQMSKFPNRLSNPLDLNSPLNGVPHWMTETLDGSALMKDAPNAMKISKNIDRAMRIPWEKFWAQISVDMSFTESQDVPYGSTTSHSAEKCRMMITLQKIPQTDGSAHANKTQLSEWPQALRISWIKPPSISWP